jgi:hypothetical protein
MRRCWWIVVVLSGWGIFALIARTPSDDRATVGVALFSALYVAGFVALLMPSA